MSKKTPPLIDHFIKKYDDLLNELMPSFEMEHPPKDYESLVLYALAVAETHRRIALYRKMLEHLRMNHPRLKEDQDHYFNHNDFEKNKSIGLYERLRSADKHEDVLYILEHSFGFKMDVDPVEMPFLTPEPKGKKENSYDHAIRLAANKLAKEIL